MTLDDSSSAGRIGETLRIKAMLRRSWVPFFSRFGSLTDVQLAAIPRILSGENVAVMSPTASGKTEAVVAPVAERVFDSRRDGLSILYVVPTRALANDTLKRLKGPLEEMGIRTAVKHGDRPHLPSPLPNCLITTPESLDSMLCRSVGRLKDLQAVILDDVHMIDGTYRGDQLRVLMGRLELCHGAEPLSVYLLSATFGDPTAVAMRYVQRCGIVRAGVQRYIERVYLESLESLRQEAQTRKWRKILCFCNGRKSVEEFGASLQRLFDPYPVVVHHGSLSKAVREAAERTMQEERVALCIATSTLEVGIDIGDIDVVFLAEAPVSRTALLQRLGRGNRRSGKIVAAVLAPTVEEVNLVESMFDGIEKGILAGSEYSADVSVVVQQAFSLLFQHREGVAWHDLLGVLKPLGEGVLIRRILDHLQAQGMIETRGGRFFGSEEVMNLGESGKIHSNIPDSTENEVVDVASGRRIGKVYGVPDEVFLLAGRAWRVVGRRTGRIDVRPWGGGAIAPRYPGYSEAGAFTSFLPPDLLPKNSPTTSPR
ncbi:MAG: DEAD/DEAH box helicase [Candidatus Sumerlaeota bacterium]|nr:DEAD/DEAH box helicase [Candidatus Sumerlaeota bacterium]